MNDIDRARLAAEILGNEVYQESYELVKNELLQSIVESKVTEDKERERLYMAIKVLEHIEQIFQYAIQKGEIKKSEIERLENAKGAKTRWY